MGLLLGLSIYSLSGIVFRYTWKTENQQCLCNTLIAKLCQGGVRGGLQADFRRRREDLISPLLSSANLCFCAITCPMMAK